MQPILRPRCRTSAVVYAAAIGLPASIALAAGLQPWVTPDVLFRDAVAVAEGEAYFGLVSNLGILVWAATAAICLFAAFVDQRDPAHRSFMLWSGAITTVLLLDDLFLLHEAAFLQLFGINEMVIFTSYGAIVAVYLLRHRSLIAESETRLLAAALAMFALSLLFDKLCGARAASVFAAHPSLELVHRFTTWIDPVSNMLEDGPKLIGICAWAAYLMRTASRALRLRTGAHRGA